LEKASTFIICTWEASLVVVCLIVLAILYIKGKAKSYYLLPQSGQKTT